MSLADLASIGSLIGGVGVVLSLLFVGFQLRQNTRAVRASASQAHALNWQQVTLPIVADPGFARVWRLGLGDVDSLTDDERVRFVVFLSGAFRFFEAARLQWRHGQLDDEHWQNIEPTLREMANYPGIAVFWAMRRQLHSPEFQEWFEALPRKPIDHGFYDKPR